MASFYDDASLVVIPSGYKTSKIYAEKPTDGSGDLTFTRASDATRVASNGLIEKVRTNLILYSEQFNDASWAANLNASATANATTAPNGTATADKIVEDTSTSQHYIGQTPTSITGVGHTISVFAKAAERSFLFLFEDSAGGRSAYFDLSNGTIGTVGGSATASITSVGNGWYRCSVTYTASGTLVRMRVATATANGTASYTGNGTSGIFVWGAQVEVSDFGATDYIPTTTAAVSVGPVSNVPRLDYLGSSCPRLLLEPQRTNLALYSEQFDNAAWGKTNATITANSILSPDGYQNADTITSVSYPSTSVTQSFSATAASHTLSCFAKAGTISSFTLDFVTSGFALGSSATFNLSTLSTTITNFGATTGSTASIVNYGNGWYRCSLTVLATADNYFNQLYPAGNGTIFAWGAQLEAGAYATSYIPTLGASSVTRVADAASKTGISSLIGQTEGVIFLDFVASAKNADTGGSFSVLFTAGEVGTNFQIYTASNNLRFYKEPTTIDFVSSVNLVEGQRYKIAYAYKAGQYAFYVNGVQEGTSTNGSVPAVSSIYINQYSNGTYQAQNKFNQALLFKTRLTNAQCQELTSL
jgi:hypothetical protein